MSSFDSPSFAAGGGRRRGLLRVLCRLALPPLLPVVAVLPALAEVPDARKLKHSAPLLPATAGLLVVDRDALAFISGPERVSTYVYKQHEQKWKAKYFRPGIVDSVHGLALLNTDEGAYLALAGRLRSENCLYMYHSADHRFFKPTSKGPRAGCHGRLYPTLQTTGLEFLRYGENKLALWIGYFGGVSPSRTCARGYLATADCSPLKVIENQDVSYTEKDCTQSATRLPGSSDSLVFGRSYLRHETERRQWSNTEWKDWLYSRVEADLIGARMNSDVNEICSAPLQPAGASVTVASGTGPTSILAASSDLRLAFAIHDGGSPEPNDPRTPAAVRVWTAEDWAKRAESSVIPVATDDPSPPLSLSTAGPFVAYSSVSEKAIHVYKWAETEWQHARIPTEYPVVGVLSHPKKDVTQLATIQCSVTEFDYPGSEGDYSQTGWRGRMDDPRQQFGKIPWCDTTEACAKGSCVQVYELKGSHAGHHFGHRRHHGACEPYNEKCWVKKQDLAP